MNLSDSDFEIFGLPVQFELDSSALGAAYLRLQSQTHPDRFANGSAQEKRLAMQWSTRINEAYQRLKNPLERAIYWCELQGEHPRGHQHQVSQALLIQHIEWREQFEEITQTGALEALIDTVHAEKHRCLNAIANEIDLSCNAKAATATTQALLFIDSFLTELNKKLELLEDAS